MTTTGPDFSPENFSTASPLKRQEKTTGDPSLFSASSAASQSSKSARAFKPIKQGPQANFQRYTDLLEEIARRHSIDEPIDSLRGRGLTGGPSEKRLQIDFIELFVKAMGFWGIHPDCLQRLGRNRARFATAHDDPACGLCACKWGQFLHYQAQLTTLAGHFQTESLRFREVFSGATFLNEANLEKAIREGAHLLNTIAKQRLQVTPLLEGPMCKRVRVRRLI